ncbi:sulfatase [Membranihabitans marinus]
MACMFLVNSVQAQEGRDLKNVILIIADDLGWTDLSSYGSDLHETPNLDDLARHHLKFTQFYSASPVCSPTRASIITGKYPGRLHMTTHFENSGDYNEKRGYQNLKMNKPKTIGNLPLTEITLAETLRSAGYFTAHIGKWHLGNFDYYPENHGFDINIGGTAWGAPDTYWFPFGGNNYQKQLRYIPGMELISQKGDYLTDRMTDRALEIIEAKQDQPFFIHMSYHNPHTPMEGKPDYVEYFKKKVRPSMRHKNYIYAAMIASLDENVGRILDRVKALGQEDNTIIIFISDNGGRVGTFQDWETVANNEPLRSGKGSLYEGGIRVPMIVKWPGHTEGRGEIDEAAITNDIYPTIVDMLGLDPVKEQTVDGVSLVGLMENKDEVLDRTTLFWHFPHYYTTTTPANAVRKGDWKLIHYFEDDRLELYNLSNDIEEKVDLAEKYEDKANELYELLQGWREETKVQYPSFNQDYRPEDW